MTSGGSAAPGRAASAREWMRTIAVTVGMLVIYFAAPLGLDDDPLPLPVATALCVVVAVALAVMIGRKIVAVLDGRSRTGLPGLALVLVLVVVAFAAAYFLVERADPGQMAQLQSRRDSLYFTLTTLVTVGYGDVHPVGQAARGIVSVQLVFNAIFVAGLVRAMLFEAQVRRTQKSGDTTTWTG